jgi:cell fate regulator YaaT (PSP1 superfamily)
VYSDHLVRLGLFGQVGRLASADGARYARKARVVCRTARGLEVGEVLGAGQGGQDGSDGMILRRVTVEDELLLARLERHKRRAFHACQQLLAQRGLPAILVDVEHLFDGRSLYFYFVGPPAPELEPLTAELAKTYDAAVQFRQFAQTLAAGCGPGCGTEQASGPGCGVGCSTCAASGACGTRRRG